MKRKGVPPEPYEEVTQAHRERIDEVVQIISHCNVKSVIDFGCGAGALLQRLVEMPELTKVCGVDPSSESLQKLTDQVRGSKSTAVELVCGSIMEADPRYCGFEAVTLVEVIEHFEPKFLSLVEKNLFDLIAPRVVVITTPNREFNEVYGIGSGRFRHADHRFEWTRSQFRQWASGVAQRQGYKVDIYGIGEFRTTLGHSTHIGVFSNQEPK